MEKSAKPKNKKALIFAALVFVFIVIIFAFSGKKEKTEKANTDQATLVELATVTTPETGRKDFYVSVNNFSNKRSEAVASIEKYVKEFSGNSGLAYTIHFMDTVQFTPPTNGKAYGLEQVRRKVIAQYNVVNNNHVIGLEFDPFGYGVYQK